MIHTDGNVSSGGRRSVQNSSHTVAGKSSGLFHQHVLPPLERGHSRRFVQISGSADHDGLDVVIREDLFVCQHARDLEPLGQRLRLWAIGIGDRHEVDVYPFRKDREIHELAHRADAQKTDLEGGTFRLGHQRASPCARLPQMKLRPTRRST